ncbi:hypothetical protein GOP47_0020696 [Adiantum capillus-veneris]|uniref:Maspardin n=1 Tax=Adiantum capillus-veneris TaxID=13818 RepID=A0A9D4U9M1_ADICA|nr:hypothetical protein GOP47_0020696 [Adiantum capillus-veneris]
MATRPGDYTHFKSIVPLKRVSIGTKYWRYYDYGPKSVPPLICIPGTAGTAEVFYKQILTLSSKGYRVIAADAPPVWSHQEWVNSFEKFLDTIGVHHVHIYGTSLGGFLAQLFAHYRPRRVQSLVLSNTFLDTREFAAATTWSSLITWTPEFLLKRYILSGIRDGPQEPLIADSIDFVVSQLETLSKKELAARLTLNTTVGAIGQVLVPDSDITIMDTNDYCATPQALREEVGVRYGGARKAVLKTGGDFPFLSRADEVNLHLQLHLRRVGVEALVVTKGPGGSDDSAQGEDGRGFLQHPDLGMPPAEGGTGEGSSTSSSNSSASEAYRQKAGLGNEWTMCPCNATDWDSRKKFPLDLLVAASIEATIQGHGLPNDGLLGGSKVSIMRYWQLAMYNLY